jgi:hypothetical protein
MMSDDEAVVEVVAVVGDEVEAWHCWISALPR